MRTTAAAVIMMAALSGTSAAFADEGSERASGERVGERSTYPTHRMTWRLHYGVWRTNAERLQRPASVRAEPMSQRNQSRAFAFRLVSRKAWSPTQFRCLDSLWTRESNWNHLAQNPSSGAYGIPQALPADKMARVSWDWRHNPRTQIRWGIKYIKGRYGSPCGAWGHFRSHNWY
ncbi:lytic transglycosylase domain-containing protein [Acrocarpospora catenulata]|uniref:aggregation-promoting factor C-terminal-like domain-containing protein n=1 Tax=Acrocarpospora catenulata TaxID=2836182 RepID=UPI002023B842|nr:lytic transglycosylase domain-containing protein [Acrocarpospora catenulata]